MATYTTKQGDTWDAIAYSQLGSEWLYPQIIELNSSFCDVVIFPEGVILELPEITDAEVNNAQADLSPWRRWDMED